MAVAPAQADGPNEPWPEALRHRNARYAQLARSSDAAGDARERVLADCVTLRSTDPLGDREEVRRALAWRHDPPRATTYARVDRVGDAPGDQREAVLATLPRARRDAELRRYRDLHGDMEEFTRWQVDRVRHGPLRWTRSPDGAVVADERENTARRNFIEERGLDREDAAAEREARRDQRDEDRDIQRSEELQERNHERRFLNDRDLEREDARLEREDARLEREQERDADRDAERAEGDVDRDLDKLEGDSERALERDESRLERAEERDVERQIQQEEENTLDVE